MVSTTTQSGTCPQCGSKGVKFEPSAHQLQCDYCGWTEAIPENPDTVQELSFDHYLTLSPGSLTQLASETLSVTCPSCGATTDFVPPQVAGDCPFCGTHLVSRPTEAKVTLQPNGILPFHLDRKTVQTNIREWLGQHWFAPNDLKKMAQAAGIQGVYLPFWTYDAFTTSRYIGERGEYYYETETYYETNEDGEREEKTREVRKTRWYPASGRVERFFDDVIIPASHSIPMRRLKSLEPWEHHTYLKPYEESYLTGYKVERYQIDLKEGFELAKQDMARLIEGDVRRDIGGDTQRVHSVSTHYTAITFKHLLFPVWIFSYRYRSKPYQVVVNAKTGEILGDRPMSIFKITLASVSGILVAAGIAYGVYLNQTQPTLPVNQPAPVEVEPLQ